MGLFLSLSQSMGGSTCPCQKSGPDQNQNRERPSPRGSDLVSQSSAQAEAPRPSVQGLGTRKQAWIGRVKERKRREGEKLIKSLVLPYQSGHSGPVVHVRRGLCGQKGPSCGYWVCHPLAGKLALEHPEMARMSVSAKQSSAACCSSRKKKKKVEDATHFFTLKSLWSATDYRLGNWALLIKTT